MSDKPLTIPIPGCAPRRHGRFARGFGRLVLRLGGWRVVGEWPDVPRCVIIVAPHSSAWDAVWGIAAKLAMQLDVVFLGKAELFRGPVGMILRAVGGRPVNRVRPGGIVRLAVDTIHSGDACWYVLAPEGTRRRVDKWKSGFWRIARAAEVPVVAASFHYPTRELGIGPLVELTDDLASDLMRIRGQFRSYVGKNRDTL